MTITCPILDWHGCYDGNWNGLIVPEAFRHPAKFAPGLVDRIYRHGFAHGWWSAGDLIGDPFGGIGGGGIIAAAHRLRWVGVEIEPRFVALAQQNFRLHAKAWKQLGDPHPIIVQGDARGFAAAALLASGEAGTMPGIVTSAPYGDAISRSADGPDTPHPDGFKRMGCGIKDRYGSTTGQIGALRVGSVDSVVTSPPFLCARSDTTASRPSPTLPTSHNPEDWKGRGLDAVVTSPPYGGNRSIEKNSGTIDFAKNYETYRASGGGSTFESYVATQQRHTGGYGETQGQIGECDVETYWQAMAQVYRECFDALRPGGVMAVVMKDYVKDKRRVPLCDDTLKLLVCLGFEPVLRARAHLVKERSENTFAGVVTTRTERKSFFRRLAESKGSPRIDWEEVICVRRPA